VDGAARAHDDANREAVRIDDEIIALDDEYHRSLKEAGECPLCGQKVQ
jgi:hypothetical protein